LRFAKKLYEHQDIKWNGRQIRNSFRTALALAEHEVRDEKALRGTDDVQVVLGAKQFRQVAETSAKFDNYLMEIHGADNSRAQPMEFRNNFSNPSPAKPSGIKGDKRKQKKKKKSKSSSDDIESDSETDSESDVSSA